MPILGVFCAWYFHRPTDLSLLKGFWKILNFKYDCRPSRVILVVLGVANYIAYAGRSPKLVTISGNTYNTAVPAGGGKGITTLPNDTQVLYMSFDRFLLAVESRDLSQTEKILVIRQMFTFSILQNFNLWMIKITVIPNIKNIWHRQFDFIIQKFARLKSKHFSQFFW